MTEKLALTDPHLQAVYEVLLKANAEGIALIKFEVTSELACETFFNGDPEGTLFARDAWRFGLMLGSAFDKLNQARERLTIRIVYKYPRCTIYLNSNQGRNVQEINLLFGRIEESAEILRQAGS